MIKHMPYLFVFFSLLVHIINIASTKESSSEATLFTDLLAFVYSFNLRTFIVNISFHFKNQHRMETFFCFLNKRR